MFAISVLYFFVSYFTKSEDGAVLDRPFNRFQGRFITLLLKSMYGVLAARGSGTLSGPTTAGNLGQ